MNGNVDAKMIRKAIADQKAAWKPKDHRFLKLSPQQQVQRLGALLDERNLSELRAMPRQDIARVIAEARGLRLYQATQKQTPSASRKTKAPQAGLPFERNLLQLDSDILEIIRKYFLFCRRADWRNRWGRNNVTPVKDQGACGSCVSFGGTATLESMILIEHNVSMDLSEAELLFCGGGSCGGWWPSSAITYLRNKGLSHETCFPYQDHNMPCTTCAERNGEAVKITHDVVLWSMEDRKHYICYVGPVMCVFEVYSDFFGYDTGVYSHVTGDYRGLHCVEVIGHDESAGGCWICKNSWGTGWGDGGFFRIAYGQCGIDSTYPFWGVSGTQWFS